MAGLLSGSNGTSSSMRFTFILVVVGAFILMISAAIYIVVSAFNSLVEQPEWTAIGIFAIGIAGIITGAGYNKVQQKKVEKST